MDNTGRRAIAAWLFICCLMVFATLVVGGVTRLTHSGLSIVRWQPIVGTVPPLTQADWQRTFAQYQKTPEYQQVNRHMDIGEFKHIFWWEYAHRLLGRSIGLVFLLPFLYFLARRRVDRALAPRLAGIFVLGGLQGAMGWYMVKSGLVEDPRVSQYRLTAHLGLAFVIFTAMFWVALGLINEREKTSRHDGLASLQRFAAWLALIVFVMVLAGGFLAGLHGGLAYNTFPSMNGHFVPPDMFALSPWFANFFNNPSTAQFDHRLIAWLLILLVPAFWLRSWRVTLAPRARLAANLLLLVFALQVGLGISTLLLVVPVPLAALHQDVAMVVFATVLWVNHELRVLR
ncbi:heme A synthase [mine drainage metagenome]|uniref:Heme A synthase n=1 Tax=mine drainage metagenome TaxID=410659 RepID=A0A1J5QTY7_9ZZZZ